MKFNLYSEFPALAHLPAETYIRNIELVKELEHAGYTGSLIYYHHKTLDPWTIAMLIIQNTANHIPLLALQQYTMPPISAAKKICSIARLFNRTVHLNMVTGQAPFDLEQVNNSLGEGGRFERLIEYTTVLAALLEDDHPYSYDGRHYSYQDLQVFSRVEPHMRPKIFIASGSGSSESIIAANRIGDVLLGIPAHFEAFKSGFLDKIGRPTLEAGIKFKLVCRPTTREARVAASADRSDFITRSIKKSSLMNEAGYSTEEENFLFPGTFTGDAPLLVGSYEEVAEYLNRYLQAGVSNIIVGNLSSTEDIRHCDKVFGMLR